MHGKERAIAPALKQYLHSDLVVLPFDTDAFGSFTGEIPRPGTQRETLIKKAQAAAKEHGYPYVIASEGSFGPHPAMPWMAAGLEMLVFYDHANERSIIESAWSSATNYAHLNLATELSELPAFLERVGFPSHALVLRERDSDAEKGQVLAKGIQDPAQWQALLAAAQQQYRVLQLETDMRAHVNPTRMAQIASLAEQFVKRLVSLCPSCGVPGFGERSLAGHLPCASCHAPTHLAAYECIRCDWCQVEIKKPRSDQKTTADPGCCDFCNP